MPEINDKEKFEYAKRIVSKILNFQCTGYTDNFLARRIDIRLRRNNLGTYAEYLHFLEKNPAEQEALRKELTIHVTHFFRDKEFWQEFNENIMPEVVRKKKDARARDIRVWSAGCSSGEEPLSIAICLKETLKENMSGFNIRIYATDYDKDTIERAKAAHYDDQQFQETSDDLKSRYFTKTADGSYLAKNTLTSMITYNAGDILISAMPKNIDLLFCRNTVIYFNTDTKNDLYVKFYNILNPGGYFIMGKTECLNGPARDMFKVRNVRERIYVKP